MLNEKLATIENLKAAGELAKASNILKAYIDSISGPITEQKAKLISDLCHIYIRQSRYAEAYHESHKIKSFLQIRNISFFWILSAAFLMAANTLINQNIVNKICHYFVKKIVGFPNTNQTNLFPLYEGLLWGIYWQDMRQALKMNIFTVLSSGNDVELIKSQAFLHYTLAFMGYSGIGIKGLKKLVKKCEDNQKNMVRDLLTWVGVAYQMGGFAKECLSTHQRLAKEFPNAEPFHQVISYASQLNVSISELGPEEVAQAADKCFSISFALKESRNHIQIYGGKAALLAMEGRHEEAHSFLERSLVATQRNSNTLDDLIFHRLAAVASLNMGDFTSARHHISQAKERMQKYAFVMWYWHEIVRLSAIANYQSKATKLNKYIQSIWFLAQAIWIPNWNLFKKTIRLFRDFIRQEDLSYWSHQSQFLYYKNRHEKSDNLNRTAIIEKITSLLTLTILENESKPKDKAPSLEDLRKQASQVFSGAQIIFSKSLNEALNLIRAQYGLSASFIHNQESDSIRAACPGNLFFIAVGAPSNQNLAIGVVIKDLNIHSHEIVETALRILITLYVASQTSFEIEKERALHQKYVAISSVASAVAHDIRAPLMAFEIVLKRLEKIGSEEKNLIENACSRIRAIASDLLNKGAEIRERKVVTSLTPSLNPNEFFEINDTLSKVLEEKKVSFHNVQFTFRSMTPVYVVGNQALFQRIISNLVDNSCQAMDPTSAGKVEVEIRDYKEKIGLYIKDNGRGIPAEIINQIGNPGFSYKKTNGNGIGVWFSKSNIENWGGNFSLASKPGEGTIVSLSLLRAKIFDRQQQEDSAIHNTAQNT